MSPATEYIASQFVFRRHTPKQHLCAAKVSRSVQVHSVERPEASTARKVTKLTSVGRPRAINCIKHAISTVTCAAELLPSGQRLLLISCPPTWRNCKLGQTVISCWMEREIWPSGRRETQFARPRAANERIISCTGTNCGSIQWICNRLGTSSSPVAYAWIRPRATSSWPLPELDTSAYSTHTSFWPEATTNNCALLRNLFELRTLS